MLDLDTRQSHRHDHFSLLSVGLALGKEVFADKLFNERSLPSVTLSKGFAEYILAFAECLRHSAKKPPPVVHAGDLASHVRAIPWLQASPSFSTCDVYFVALLLHPEVTTIALWLITSQLSDSQGFTNYLLLYVV